VDSRLPATAGGSTGACWKVLVRLTRPYEKSLCVSLSPFLRVMSFLRLALCVPLLRRAGHRFHADCPIRCDPPLRNYPCDCRFMRLAFCVPSVRQGEASVMPHARPFIGWVSCHSDIAQASRADAVAPTLCGDGGDSWQRIGGEVRIIGKRFAFLISPFS
jgi:hypothetical protein